MRVMRQQFWSVLLVHPSGRRDVIDAVDWAAVEAISRVVNTLEKKRMDQYAARGLPIPEPITTITVPR